MKLIELLKLSEGKTLEFKRDLSSSEKVLRTIIAFANTAGGRLLIGVEDKSKNVRGIKDPLELEEKLANLVSDCIRPALAPEIEIVPWRKTHVVAVQVFPSSMRPHFLKSLGPEDGTFVRVGSTNRKADEFAIEELRRLVRNESFDERALAEASSEEIDFRAASEYFSETRRLKKSDLKTLKILTTHQGKEVPTVGGMLLFGKNRHEYFPDAWIQAGRFDGRDKTQIIDTTEIRSLPIRSVEEAIAFIRRNTSTRVDIGPVKRTETPTYPEPAIREAVINAVVHADYSQKGAPIRIAIFTDRIEIENPGILPFGLTIEDVQNGVSKLRNRVLGRVFHELKLIEQWGSGIQRMVSTCRDAGLKDPVLEEVGSHFRVTLFSSRTGSRKVQFDTVDSAIVKALSKGEGMSTKTLAEAIDLTPRATRTRLMHLVERGVVIEVGSGPRDPRRLYFLHRKSKR